jgi:hypothetical protein
MEFRPQAKHMGANEHPHFESIGIFCCSSSCLLVSSAHTIAKFFNVSFLDLAVADLAVRARARVDRAQFWPNRAGQKKKKRQPGAGW